MEDADLVFFKSSSDVTVVRCIPCLYKKAGYRVPCYIPNLRYNLLNLGNYYVDAINFLQSFNMKSITSTNVYNSHQTHAAIVDNVLTDSSMIHNVITKSREEHVKKLFSTAVIINEDTHLTFVRGH